MYGKEELLMGELTFWCPNKELTFARGDIFAFNEHMVDLQLATWFSQQGDCVLFYKYI